MPVQNAANSETFRVTTPTPTQIVLTRLFDAPRHLVFEALTKPEHIRRWWGILNDAYSVPVCDVDLRPGGRWRYVNRLPKGDEVAFTGVYREITSPSRLVFTETMEPHPEPGSVCTALLTEERGKTRLTLTAEYPTQEIRDMVLGSGMERGAAISYDHLEEVAASLA